MIKKIIVCLGLLFSIATIAQEGTASPYSFYGIGDVRFKGTIENRLMGGVSLSDSIHINLQNPAANASLKYTTFTVAGNFNAVKFKTYNKDDKAQRTSLDYLAVGVPIGKKFGAAFGLISYSSVGYRITNVNSERTIANNNSGTGGVNKVFVGFGYKINKNLSVGADMNYHFGKIETKSIQYNAGVQYGVEDNKISDVSGLEINLGATYNREITRKLDLYTSLVYTPQAKLNSENTETLSSIIYTNEFNNQIVESNNPLSSKTEIKLPSKIALAAGIGEPRKWMIGAEVTAKQSSNFNNRFGSYEGVNFENATKISLGGYYIPNYNSFKSYFNKVTYRAGFRYENTGLVIRNEAIKEQAFTLGLGLPLGGTFSNLNLGAEIGKRGTAKANLIQENFINVVLSLSLNDLWFIKRKYD
jgi:long-subunit fatty acid transport protein